VDAGGQILIGDRIGLACKAPSSDHYAENEDDDVDADAGREKEFCGSSHFHIQQNEICSRRFFLKLDSCFFPPPHLASLKLRAFFIDRLENIGWFFLPPRGVGRQMLRTKKIDAGFATLAA